MKYTTSVEINLPIDKVISLFNDPDNLYKWMEGLQSIKLIGGEEGQPGAKTEMIFETGKRRIEMVETIDTMSLPEDMTCTYEAKGVVNIQKTTFEKINDHSTRYVCFNEFRFSGFMKLIGWLMPGAFKKQSLKYQEDFKKFAESSK